MTCPECGSEAEIRDQWWTFDGSVIGYLCLNQECQRQFLATDQGAIVTVPWPPRPEKPETWRDRPPLL